ncbi:hypothetical protein V6X63_10150 [Spiribacter sp. 221]|uniref:hypothetical protein n=1 Tax=Spiribacter onubensis TaxID=3122420 RepID=UPI00349F5F4C
MMTIECSAGERSGCARLAAVLLTAGLILTAGAAQAFTDKIRVDNKYYYIDYSNLSYTGNETTLTGTAWYGNIDLATALASASDEPATAATDRNGAAFLYDVGTDNDPDLTRSKITRNAVDEEAGMTVAGGAGVVETYAIQTQAPTAVPEIDGVALSQGAFVTGALGLWMVGRRRGRAITPR